jgi:exopolyphosphatase/guanosine-5'-triphosphate,3'-diphosphate pyrophosphatase
MERLLNRNGLAQVTAFISRMESSDLAELDGVSTARAHQTLAGAVVAMSAMDALGVDVLELCPWALREGVILRRLDWLSHP